MIQRVITAAAALAVVVPILVFGGVPGAQVLCLAAAALALWEFGDLSAPPTSRSDRAFTTVLAALPIVAAGMPNLLLRVRRPGGDLDRVLEAARAGWAYDAAITRADWILLGVGIAFLSVPLRAVLRPGKVETAPARIGSTVYGVFYLGLTLAFCVTLRAQENGLLWIILGLAAVWLGDTGAYVGGRAFGKHKLHPRISPAKTWEGSVLGLATSIAAGFAARAVFDRFGLWEGNRMDALDVVIVSVLAGAAGQIGDLAESLLKRAVGVKDSGRMFPGHGGMLDRIDALLFALPTVYFYVKFLFR